MDLDVLRYAREIQRGGRDPSEVALGLLESTGAKVTKRYKIQSADGKRFYDGGLRWSVKGKEFNGTGPLRISLAYGRANRYWSATGREDPFVGCRIIETTYAVTSSRVYEDIKPPVT